MSEVHKRDQFRTALQCSKCGAKGHAVWEENSGVSADGPMGNLISLSDGFIQRMRDLHGQPEIACAACGAMQPD